MIRARGAALCAAVVVVTLAVTGCAANELGDRQSNLKGTLDGAGSSAQGSAQEVWVAEFQNDNASVTVNYDPSGSGAGREAFLAGGADFAGSDSALSDEELAGDFGSCTEGTQGIDLPLYISPIAVIFNAEGVDELNVSAALIAQIFSGDVDRWDDAAIAELNPNVSLPDEPITAVHRSDDSGTTKNFTDYLHQAAPDDWTSEASDTFPHPGESAQGNSGVVSAVTNGQFTIGYADASKAGDLSVAKLQVGSDFVPPSAEAAAAIADISPRVEGRNPQDIAIAVDRTPDADGVYPLVLISYLIVCQEYRDPQVAELVTAYVSYVASDEGQAAAAESAGSSPISPTLSQEVADAIASIR